MWSNDQDMPRGPWQLIIRARTESELDRAIIIIGGRIAATVSSPRLAKELAPLVARSVARAAGTRQDPASPGVSAERVVSALAALADYEDICPTPYTFPHPHPHGAGVNVVIEGIGPDPLRWDESVDAVALAATRRLAALSEQGQEVAEAAGSLLKQVAG
jgi:hypothetical protein